MASGLGDGLLDSDTEDEDPFDMPQLESFAKTMRSVDGVDTDSGSEDEGIVGELTTSQTHGNTVPRVCDLIQVFFLSYSSPYST